MHTTVLVIANSAFVIATILMALLVKTMGAPILLAVAIVAAAPVLFFWNIVYAEMHDEPEESEASKTLKKLEVLEALLTLGEKSDYDFIKKSAKAAFLDGSF